MLHDVLGDFAETLFGNQHLHDRGLFERGLCGDFCFEQVVEFVEGLAGHFSFFRLVHLDVAQLVKQRHRCPLFDGAVEAVGVNVITKDGPGAPVFLVDGGSGERNILGVRQRNVEVVCVTFEGFEVGAVRLIDHDDNV